MGIWNYWSIKRSFVVMEAMLNIPESFKWPWISSYVLSSVLVLIGFVTLLFMLRAI